MVVVNGSLMMVEQAGGSFNNGVPEEAERTLSEPIPCNISGKGRKDNRSGDVSYTSAEYEVIIDNMSEFNATEVVLYNRRCRLGTFRVQDVQYLEYVDAIKITCTQYAD